MSDQIIFKVPYKMIKISELALVYEYQIELVFSDGTAGIWDAADLLGSKDTPLTIPLRDPEAFAKAFIDNGALAWPNGLELAPWTLHAEMKAAGLLKGQAA